MHSSILSGVYVAFLCFAISCGVLMFLDGAYKFSQGRSKITKPAQVEQPVTLVEGATVPRRKRGRPRKAQDTGKIPRHRFLPIGVSNTQLDAIGSFFWERRAVDGETVVLHIPHTDGTEKVMEVPYPVKWDGDTIQQLTDMLGGWA